VQSVIRRNGEVRKRDLVDNCLVALIVLSGALAFAWRTYSISVYSPAFAYGMQGEDCEYAFYTHIAAWLTIVSFITFSLGVLGMHILPAKATAFDVLPSNTPMPIQYRAQQPAYPTSGHELDLLLAPAR
jgi:hypothetical protein